MAAPPHLMLKCPFCNRTFEAPLSESSGTSTDEQGTVWVSLSANYSSQHDCDSTGSIAP